LTFYKPLDLLGGGGEKGDAKITSMAGSRWCNVVILLIYLYSHKRFTANNLRTHRINSKHLWFTSVISVSEEGVLQQICLSFEHGPVFAEDTVFPKPDHQACLVVANLTRRIRNLYHWKKLPH
jgi:hypothetical protein